MKRMDIRKNKNKRILLTATFISFIFIIIGIGIMAISNSKVEAVSIDEVFKILGENSPLNNQIREMQVEFEKEKSREIREKLIVELEARENKINKDSEKVAYLTFDDGPSRIVTPMILDILNEYNIKATFFVLGRMVDQNPDILERIYNEGHKIGNHSYSHNYSYIYENTENFLSDFKKAERSLKNALGEDFETNLIRFPGGSFGAKKEPMKKAAREYGYTYVDWNALNGDSETVNPSKEYLNKRFKETVGNKKELIILMHDIDSKINTAKTLRGNIEYLIDKGYRFELLSEEIW